MLPCHAFHVARRSRASFVTHMSIRHFAVGKYGDSNSSFSSFEREERMLALHQQLEKVGIDSDHLKTAVNRSYLEGNDPYYGKSAIKAYKTFVSPRDNKIEAARNEDLVVAAVRCARQIDFLAKRNRSHEAEWVRHHDASNGGGQERRTYPLIVVLDNVRSAFNVGSIFRTADACGCQLVITCGITPTPYGAGSEKLAKSALNAERLVPSKHFTTTKEAINFLKTNYSGFNLIGLETTERSQIYTQYQFPGSIYDELPQKGSCFVLGNEVTGVDTEVMPLLDAIVEIPMFGQKNSLNIAACAPVVMYECLRQWGVMEQAEIN